MNRRWPIGPLLPLAPLLGLLMAACSGGPRPVARKDGVALPGDVDAAGLVHHDGGLIVGGTARAAADLGQTPLTPGPGGLVVALDKNLNAMWGAGLGGGKVVVRAFAPGPGGDVVFAAQFQGAFGGGGTLIKSHGKTDCVVGRMSAQGNVRWATRIGGGGEDDCPGLTATEDAVFVAGTFGPLLVEPELAGIGGRDAFVVRLDADGAIQGAVAFGGPGDEVVTGMALKGTVLAVVGTFTADFQAKFTPLKVPLQGPGGFIVGVDVDPTLRWGRVVGRAHTVPAAVVGTVDRAWVVAGSQKGAGFISRLDKGGNPQWRQDLSGWTAANALAMDGSDVLVAGAARGLAIRRLTSAGEAVEDYRCGDGTDAATGLAVTPAGDVAWTGRLAKASACAPAGGVAGRWGPAAP
ncbi:MAG: hypothetical protein H6702_12645 [Myxococcales bacterium]|nr:hypothetical protein [Myxococcales bacterium]